MKAAGPIKKSKTRDKHKHGELLLIVLIRRAFPEPALNEVSGGVK